MGDVLLSMGVGTTGVGKHRSEVRRIQSLKVSGSRSVLQARERDRNQT